MALMHESDRRFANLERRVGIFLLTTALIVIGVIVLVGVRQGLFTPKVAISFHDDSGRDLAAGMEVLTRGFRIGKIDSVRLDETGRVEVQLAIDKSLCRWIRRDSTARIAAKAFIGDSHIEISPGTPQAPLIAPGEVIAFVRDPDLVDVAKKVMEDLKPVLLAVKSLIEYLDNPQGDVKLAIANVREISAGLIETRAQLSETLPQLLGRVNALAGNLESLSASVRGETLPRITSQLEKSAGVIKDAGRTIRTIDAFVHEDLSGITATLLNEVIPQLHGVLANADRMATAAGGGAEKINHDLPALLANINASLENLRVITEQFVPVSRETAGVLRQGSELVEDSQALVKRTGEFWLFRTGKKAPETNVNVDSYQIGNPPAPAPAGPRAR